MAPPSIKVSSLTKSTKMATILVRATHIWDSINPKKNTVINANVLFVDQEGSQISATVWNNQKPTYLTILSEGKVYAITNFIVVDAPQKYRPVTRDIALTFYHKTTIEPMPDTGSIPLYRFELTNFENLLPLKWAVRNFLAVIGMVETIGSLELTSKGAHKLDVRLIDHRNQPMLVTLWEDKAAQFEQALEASNQAAAFVVITGLLVKQYSTANMLLSSGDGTKTYCNIDYAPLNELKNDILETTGLTEQTLAPPTKSRLVAATADDLKQATIQQILDTVTPTWKEVIRLLCEATVVAVSRDDGWYYDSCINCPRGIRFDGNMFICESCPVPAKNCTQRYKVNVQVEDSSGKATFKLFNKEVELLIGVPIEKLIAEIGQDKLGPEVPPVINNVIGKKCLFEVKLTSYNKPGCECYTVGRLSKTDTPSAAGTSALNEETETSKKQRTA